MTWWDNAPDDPVTVTVYVPALGAPASDTVSVEVVVLPDESDTLVGLRVAVKPDGGLADSATLPENILRLPRVIVEVPGVPAYALIEDGFALMLKSGRATVTDTW